MSFGSMNFKKTCRRYSCFICFVCAFAFFVAGCNTQGKTEYMVNNLYTITVYYTAVESFHSGEKIAVYGCFSQEGAFGKEFLGKYPISFVNAVKEEGTGRITTGKHSGKYLNWSHDTGYWLDSIPANAYGSPLIPFKTAAADANVLVHGTKFRLFNPLIQDDDSPLEEEATEKLLGAVWIIQDLFTPGLGGKNHIDLYIGEEDCPLFTEKSPLYISLKNTVIKKIGED